MFVYIELNKIKFDLEFKTGDLVPLYWSLWRALPYVNMLQCDILQVIDVTQEMCCCHQAAHFHSICWLQPISRLHGQDVNDFIQQISMHSSQESDWQLNYLFRVGSSSSGFQMSPVSVILSTAIEFSRLPIIPVISCISSKIPLMNQLVVVLPRLPAELA